MRRPLIWLAAATLAVGSLATSETAHAFNPTEVAKYTACQNTTEPSKDFAIVKDYSRGLWENLFDTGTVLYCGHDIPAGGTIRHGYTHIRVNHQKDWQPELDKLKLVIPNRAPATWQDLVDIALTTAISADRPSLVAGSGLCTNVQIQALNTGTGASHYINARVWTQQKSGGSYLPRDAVATAFPATSTCGESPWPSASARTSAAADATPIVVVKTTCDADGCQFVMDSNNVVAYSSATGAYYTGGPFKTLWDASRVSLGFPTMSIKCGLIRTGCYEKFSKSGSAVYHTPTTGAHFIKGKIADKWRGLDYERSFLGYPTADERCGLISSGCYSNFEGGSIHYSPATGAWSTRGKIREAWIRDGAEKGHYGYPTSDEFHPAGSPSNHRESYFENGFLYWNGTSITGEWWDPGCPTCIHTETIRI